MILAPFPVPTLRAALRLSMQAGQTLPPNIIIASASYELLGKPAVLSDRLVNTDIPDRIVNTEHCGCGLRVGTVFSATLWEPIVYIIIFLQRLVPVSMFKSLK